MQTVAMVLQQATMQNLAHNRNMHSSTNSSNNRPAPAARRVARSFFPGACGIGALVFLAMTLFPSGACDPDTSAFPRVHEDQNANVVSYLQVSFLGVF